MVLDHDYIEAVSQNLALNDLLELRSLAPRQRWSQRRHEKHKSGAATKDTFSFGHVRFCEGPLGRLRAVVNSAGLQETQAQRASRSIHHVQDWWSRRSVLRCHIGR